MKTYLNTKLLFLLPLTISGCLLGAGAVGGEAAYIASQDERSAGETIDDQLILTSLKSSLIADPNISGLRINVDVDKGTVTLRGYVNTQSEIDRIITTAYSTRGVTHVDSKLVLETPSHHPKKRSQYIANESNKPC